MDCKLEFKIEVCYFGSVGGIFEMQICNRDHWYICFGKILCLGENYLHKNIISFIDIE